MAAPRFLDLPAKLRLEVYDWLMADNKVPISTFKGLYLSCHQIKEEMDDACVKQPSQILQRILDEDAYNFEFIPPKKFSKARQVFISLPASQLALYENPKTVNLYKFSALPLESLTIKLTYAIALEFDEGAVNVKFTRCAESIIKEFIEKRAEPAVREVVFEDTTMLGHLHSRLRRGGPILVQKHTVRGPWTFFLDRGYFTYLTFPRLANVHLTGSITMTRTPLY